MSGLVERRCSLLLFQLNSDSGVKIDELSQKLETGTDTEKIAALKKIIHCIIAGIDLNRLTMQVIKFCLRSKSHEIKKLLQIYWEVLDKKDGKSGKLKPEMILVCNHLLQDLQHANEFIRGSTARLLCRIDESEILEQLIPQLLDNLSHRHSYVRKNAVLAIMSICRQHPDLIPDAAQRVYKFLMNETNALAKRNAFLMLTDCDLRNALDFFISIADKIGSYPETMQISILELMRKVCRTLPVPKSIFVKCAAQLLDAQSNAVVYEAANTLLSLTPLDSAVNRALEAYTRLLQSESDQNVKLIVINRLNSLKGRYDRNLKHVIMDILRGLSTPNLDIREQILSLVLDLASIHNIEDIIACLKKEMMSTNNCCDGDALTMKYRNLLVETIHECAVKFPTIANGTVIHLLMNYIGEDTHSTFNVAYDVILFVKEIVEEYPNLRVPILNKLLHSLPDIQSEQVFRVAFWVFGEYTTDLIIIAAFIRKVFEIIGDLPFMNTSCESDITADTNVSSSVINDTTPIYSTRTVVLDDGTYAQETMAMNNDQNTITGDHSLISSSSSSNLRQFIKNGEYFLACVLSQSLLKLMIRFFAEEGECPIYNELKAKCLLMVTAILRYGSVFYHKNKKMSMDCKERMTFVLHCLLSPSYLTDTTMHALTVQCQQNFGLMLKHRRERETKKKEEDMKHTTEAEMVAFDNLLNIRQLRGVEFSGFDEDDHMNIIRAAGNKSVNENLKSRLSRVVQLTGFSDPVYAEACVTVHQFDIVLDFLIINNTHKTLQDLTLELHTSGDLKLVEKPTSVTLAGQSQCKINASIKVSSTENGVIFGNICYRSTGANSDSHIVVMNCIHMDIVDYVDAHSCTEEKFRAMWTEFEWENKVPVKTDICDLHRYVKHISSITNMQLLTPIETGGTNFLAANMHAKSIFGEHALMNVSIELKEDAIAIANGMDKNEYQIKEKVCGHIRIRCKSQGIALSLGEKITNKQRSEPR